MEWIESEHTDLPLTRQCELAGVPRATVYRRLGAMVRQQHEGQEDNELCALIDEEYTCRPFYGSRRMAVFLRGRGHRVNRKRVQRLMRKMGLAGMAPGPATSKPHPQHKVYPYLLRGVAVTRPNQVWSTDLTYIRLARGFAYLVAIIDWYSRRVLAWRISKWNGRLPPTRAAMMSQSKGHADALCYGNLCCNRSATHGRA
jgi:putative transposase